jgi:hypothetical protein
MNSKTLGLLCVFVLTAETARPLQVGDTLRKVLAEKGQPAGQMQAGDVCLLDYPGLSIRLKDAVVVEINVVLAASTPNPTPTPTPTSVPTQTLTVPEQIDAAKAKLSKATEQVKAIVNRPPPSVPITPDMKVASYGNAWFHPGATKPDFDNVDVRTTRDLSNYSKFAFVSSDLNPGIAFPGDQLEFNPMLKYFYTDRSLPKLKLSEEDMVEINRLYRIIGKCEADLGRLQAAP